MDFGRTQLSGLLNNVTHEKARYAGILLRLKSLLRINRGKKLINNKIDKLLFTSSPKEIYSNINFQHPIVSILLGYIEKLEGCGNGKAYFLELLDRFIDSVLYLLENGIYPKEISQHFMKASFDTKMDKPPVTQEGSKSIEGVSDYVKEYIRNYVNEERVADILIEAIQRTKSFDKEKIRIFKIGSGTFQDSYLVDGFVLNRKPEGSVVSLSNTTVGLFDCPFDISRTELKGTVLFEKHDDLVMFSNRELEQIKGVVDSLNVNVVIVHGTVDDKFVEFANRRNILVLRVTSKFDLLRVRNTVGGTIYTSLGPIKDKGYLSEVSTFQDAGREMTRIVAGSAVSTVVLKHTLRCVLDETERVISECLESLERSPPSTAFLSPSFSADMSKRIGSENVVKEKICSVLSAVRPPILLHNDGYRSLRYALEVIGVLLDVDDFLVAKRDILDVKPQQRGTHWDEQ